MHSALAGLIDHYAAKRPAKPALTDGVETLTYGALRRRACALAGALLQQGVRPGARLAVMAENSLEFPVLVAAASYGCFALVPINVRLGRSEVAAIICESGSEVGFADAACQWAVSDIPGVRWIGLESDAYGKMLAARPPAKRSTMRRHGDALLQYATGGTTGVPKGCLLTEANFRAQTLNFMEAVGLNAGDRYGLLMPFFHMAAGGMAVALLFLGATGVLLPRRDPAALMALIERERVTRLNLPAAVLRDLRDAGLLRRLPDLAWLGAGNGSEQDLLQLLAERVTCNVWGWYGQTEATNITTAPRSTDEALKGFGCIGRPARTARVRVVRADGTDADPDEIGELWTAGPHVMAGYWGRRAETAATMAGEWLRSGDLVRRDAEGTLFIVDRLKEMIKSGGETIYPRELEVVLERHAAVAEAAVIGVAHPRWGESPCALIVRKLGASLDEAAVIEHCRANLAAFKRPTSVVFVDALPRNVAGKVRKDVLRRQWGTPGVPEKWRVA